jgi:hypothetical protein
MTLVCHDTCVQVTACPPFQTAAATRPLQELAAHVRCEPPADKASAAATLSTLRSLQFTCVFLATKVADQARRAAAG